MMVSEHSTRVLATLLEERTGQQLSISRRWRIETALAGLVKRRGIASLDQLILGLSLRPDPALARDVVESLLNNETYFFRDRTPFDMLAAQALPELARRRAATRRISIWSAGCSTGQEPLSIAMLFAEQPEKWAGWTLDIVGTDISESVIETAKVARYSQFQVQRGLGVMQMLRWFQESPEGWQADDRLKRMIRFQVHNLLDPHPRPMRFDIILCRNLLLYFSAANRKRAFDRLSEAMAPDGWLMLGAGETVVGQTDSLVPDLKFRGLYRRGDPPVHSLMEHRRAAGT